MVLPLSDTFESVLACYKCSNLSNWPHYQKLHLDHECPNDMLLVKLVGDVGGSKRKCIPGYNPSLFISHRLPSDKVGPKGWLLVRPRPQIMRSQAGKVFGGNFKLCESVTLNKPKCRNGGINICDRIIFNFLSF